MRHDRVRTYESAAPAPRVHEGATPCDCLTIEQHLTRCEATSEDWLALTRRADGLCGRCGREGAAGAAGLCSTCYNLPEVTR